MINQMKILCAISPVNGNGICLAPNVSRGMCAFIYWWQFLGVVRSKVVVVVAV